MKTFRSFTEEKKIDLKDLTPVDYKPEEDDLVARNAKKRKHEDVSLDGEEQLDEILNVAQRRKRGIITKRNKSKLKRGRKKASLRIADKDRLKGRARRQAKGDLIKKLTKGISKADLSPQRRAEIERRLSKMGTRIDRNQRKLLPTVRKRDRGM